MNTERAKNSAMPLRRKRAAPRLEVDHAVSVDKWNELITTKYPDAVSKDNYGNDIPIPIGGFVQNKLRSEAIEFINHLGNTSLLIRSYNRGKNSETFGKFLKDVLGDDNRVNEWANSMEITPALLEPALVQ